MPTRYSSKPDTSFWRRSVTRDAIEPIDPVVATPFTIAPAEAVATAGSCFAQHISNALQAQACNYLITERGPASTAATDETYGVFPARFGNIYSVRQLLQLMRRAYGLFYPVDTAWLRADGRSIDPFRPLVQSQGFTSPEAVAQDRVTHLEAVREMFETCDVFVFTLGLTERFESTLDGAVFPLVPEAVAVGIDPARYAFVNATVAEMTSDLREFIDSLRVVNPGVRVILTVSPVPLIATFEDRHVLVSNAYSKAALRVVAEETVSAFSQIAYFPSYEIITAPHLAASYFEDDLRDVRREGVDHAIAIFMKHFVKDPGVASLHGAPPARALRDKRSAEHQSAEEALMRRMQGIICDEEIVEEIR